jgi:hypothetical protein
MARTIGSITLDDGVCSFVSEVNIPSVRDVQLAQIVNRRGRMTRVKEDAHPLIIDVRGTWKDGGGKYWRDYKAALLNQSRAAFTLGDGTRYEMVDVTEIADTKLAQSGALTATPDCLYAYTMKVACYEPYVREVAPTLQVLGSVPAQTGLNRLTADQASLTTSLSGWNAGNANTFLGLAAPNAVAFNSATFEGDLGGWTASTNATIAQSTAQALHGTHCMAVTSISAGDMWSVSPYKFAGYPVSPGSTYSVVAFSRAAVTPQSVNAAIGFFDATGNLLVASIIGSSTTDTTSGWSMVYASGVAPAGAAYGYMLIRHSSSGAGEVHYVDCAGFFAGTANTWTAPGWTALNGTQTLGVRSALPGQTAAITNAGTSGIPVTVGTTYTAMGWSQAAQTARSVGVNINWYNSAGTFVSTTTGTTTPNSTSGWTQVTVTGVAPATAAYAAVGLIVLATAVPGEIHYWDEMLFADGTSTTWSPGGYSGLTLTSFAVSYPGTAYAEPTFQLAIVIPSGIVVQQLSLQNTTTGETCIVPGLNLYAGSWTVLLDASGSSVPAAGAASSPNNNGYALLAIPSIGYGVTVCPAGGNPVDADFSGRPVTLVPSTTPNVPPSPQTNNLVLQINATGAITSATLSVLAPSRYVR